MSFRILALLIAGALFAPPAGAQAPRATALPDGVAASGRPGPHAAEPAASATAGLGRSGAVRVALAAVDEPVDPGVLAAAGAGWEESHHWRPLHAPGPRVLGEAVAELRDFNRGEVRAPDRPGVWRLENAAGDALTVITKVPAVEKQTGRLNGYYIGSYPGPGRRDAYAPPAGFIEVTPQIVDLPVSDHLRLGQFLTKDQFDVWPKYVVLEPALIDKLELVVQELHLMGIRADRVHVMSGYRTPQYNGPGGNGRAALSRHMYGDAADVWIDNNGDGQMDDLNGDGRIDIDDAAVILRAVERVERRYPELVGGAGLYSGNHVRGPYIHIDARGTHSRW